MIGKVGWVSDDYAFRLIAGDAAWIAERAASQYEGCKRLRALPPSLAIHTRSAVRASRLRAAAARLRAVADDESTVAPPGFSPAILTAPDGRADALARELVHRALREQEAA